MNHVESVFMASTDSGHVPLLLSQLHKTSCSILWLSTCLFSCCFVLKNRDFIAAIIAVACISSLVLVLLPAVGCWSQHSPLLVSDTNPAAKRECPAWNTSWCTTSCRLQSTWHCYCNHCSERPWVWLVRYLGQALGCDNSGADRLWSTAASCHSHSIAAVSMISWTVVASAVIWYDAMWCDVLDADISCSACRDDNTANNPPGQGLVTTVTVSITVSTG